MPRDEAWWADNCHLSGEELARKHGGDGGNWRREIRAAKPLYPFLSWRADPRHSDPLAEAAAERKAAQMAAFMSKGRTEAELAEAGFTLSEAREAEGFDLFETRNVNYERVYLLLAKPAPIALKPREWSYRWATDTDGTEQPYLMVQMPEMPQFDKLKIVPLADVHYGSNACMIDKFREYVGWIASDDSVFAIIPGDLFENSHGDSCKGISVYEQTTRPADQVEELRDILAPIAHKILWALPGNHEDRSRTRDYDPLERLCEMLGVPYSYEPIFSDVLWRGNVFSFHTQHGRAGGQTKGGKMNAAARPQEMQDFVMFTIMAHVHDGDVSRNTCICRDRVNFRLAFRKQYIVICPSFFGYFRSYASKAGYKPGSYGSINMDIFANGDYHANS